MELLVRDLSKSYARKTALSQVNFKLSAGVYGLLGPNGAGKTTLLHLLSGILLPSEGKVQWNGREIQSLGKRYRRILGFQPQEAALYPNFTPREFLSYMAAVKGMRMDRQKLNRKIEDLLNALNLYPDRDRKLREFSGGMKQRVNIAQAVLANPKVLLLDEPTAGLDPGERIRLKNYISETSENRIVIWSTHIVSDIDTIAQEILLLKDGVLIKQASPISLKESLRGKIYLLEIPSEEIPRFKEQFQIGNVYRKETTSVIRIVSEYPLKGAVPAEPSLEDVSLYFLDQIPENMTL